MLFLASSFRSYLVLVLAMILVPGVIYWIFNSVFKTANNLKRAWGNVILGSVFCVIFLVCFLVDNLSFLKESSFASLFESVARLRSLAFLIGFFDWGLVISIVNFTRGARSNQRLTRTSPLRREALQEMMAIVYRMGEEVFLYEANGMLSPVKAPFNRTFFPAELINSINQKYGVVTESDDAKGEIRRIGTFTITKEKKKYECYLVDTLTIPVGSFRRVDPRMIGTLSLAPQDQEIVLRTLMREKFDIVR